jgi:hypothetical protein
MPATQSTQISTKPFDVYPVSLKLHFVKILLGKYYRLYKDSLGEIKDCLLDIVNDFYNFSKFYSNKETKELLCEIQRRLIGGNKRHEKEYPRSVSFLLELIKKDAQCLSAQHDINIMFYKLGHLHSKIEKLMETCNKSKRVRIVLGEMTNLIC